jgi:predicted nucleic acid-binding protein
MSTWIFLDTGLLGMLTNPKASPETEACSQWFEMLLDHDVEVAIPEIADYELRRELIRGDFTAALARLDRLKSALHYVPINTATMLQAANFWAAARRQHRPAADDKALDADVILAAQANQSDQPGRKVFVATTNTKHLGRFVAAMHWRDLGQSTIA